MEVSHINRSGRRRIGLALGGGVARGPAHIGVLAVLEEAGIPIDCVAGTSAGSIIGAAYCAGLPMPLLTDLALQTGWHTLCRPVLSRRGILSFARLESWIEGLLGELDVRDLAVPFAAVAADIQSGETVLLRQGSLARAVRASCSVPGIVTPVEMNGRLLVDGAITDNLPVRAVRSMGADYVIGVDLFAPGFKPHLGPLGFGASALETLIRQAGGGVQDADCLIVPDIADASFFRFSNSAAYIRRGEEAARRVLPSLLASLGL